MGSGEECKHVSSKIRQDTARKEKAVDSGIAKLNICASLRKRSEKTTTLQSDRKRDFVITINDLSEPLTPDTSEQSETASADNWSTSTPNTSTLPLKAARSDNDVCMLPEFVLSSFPSKVFPDQVFSEDENEAKYDNEIREGKGNDQKLDDKAVTSDETFEQFEAGEEVALIDIETVLESELASEPEPAGEGAVGEDKGRESALPSRVYVKHLSTEYCDLELSYEDFVAHEAQVKAMGKKCVPETLTHVRLFSTENLVEMVGFSGLFDGQKSYDSDIIAFPAGEENYKLTLVSTELASIELDEEKVAERDCECKSPLDRTTYPNWDAEENVNAELMSTTICTTDTPKPTKAVDIKEDVTSKKSNCQAGYAESLTNFCEGVRHVNALCVDAKFQIELMGRFACTCADILFDDVSVESFHSLVVNASPAEDEEVGGVNKNGSHVSDSSSIKEEVSATVDDPFIASSAEDEEIGAVNKNGSRVSSSASINEKVFATLDDPDHLLRGIHNFDLGEAKATTTAKRKFVPWERLTKRKKSLKTKSSKNGLRKLSDETKIAINMMLAAKEVNAESAETKKTKDVNRESLETKETEAAAMPPKRKKMNADAEPLGGQESNADWRSMPFLEWGIMRVLESALLPKEDDASYQSESAISKVEDGDTIVDDTLRHANTPVFVERQKSARPDMTGATTSVTDDEAESPEIEQAVEVAIEVDGDSTKILETKPVWTATVNPNTDSSYYYNSLTRETTCTIHPDFAKE